MYEYRTTLKKTLQYNNLLNPCLHFTESLIKSPDKQELDLVISINIYGDNEKLEKKSEKRNKVPFTIQL